MRSRAFGRSLIGPVVVIGLWQVIYSVQVLQSSLFPSPLASALALYRVLSSGAILPDIGYTFLRMFAGYALASIVGIGIGLLIGMCRPFYEATIGMVDFFRSIPVTTLYPVFVLSFGIGNSSKVAMVFWASFFVIALNSAYGVLQSPKLRAQMASLYGAKGAQIFRWIVFYDALPQTMIGLRIALSYAFIVEILCEMFMGSEFGVGQKITEAWTTYAIDQLFGLILLSGIFGFILNRLFVYVERHAVPWVAR